jgi:aspartokinase/homoserine dehydrogenase 1
MKSVKASSNLPPRTLLMKFGGTSVGTAEAMSQCIHIIKDEKKHWQRLVVVISALSKVTNLLIEGALEASSGDEHTFRQNALHLSEMHNAISTTLINAERRQGVEAEIERLVAEFTSLCQAIAVLGEATPRALDAVASLGERMSTRLLAAALENAGVQAVPVEASQLIETDDCFQNAHPDFKVSQHKTRQVLEPLLTQGVVPVVTGFIGATPSGMITTLGRGGSDYSAGILGAILPVDEVWIWTDVDGVMTADPRLAPDARTIPEITYREIAELAYFGAKVLHPKTIRPVVDAGIGLRICNTFNPQHPGTHLVTDNETSNGKKHNGEVVKAVTSVSGLRLITVEGRGMLGVPGVAARTFSAVASTGVSVPLITQASSEQSICFAAPTEAAERVVNALEKTFILEITHHDIDRIWATSECAIVTAVGVGMSHTPGVAGRIFSALGSENVNVIAIAQGSSEVAISLVVAAEDNENAVKILHRLTF